MKKFIIFFLLINKVVAQPNLVPNYSFEDSVDCIGMPKKATPFPKPWYRPITSQCCGYVNSCFNVYGITPPTIYWSNRFSFQYPRTGNGNIGLFAYADTIQFGYNARSYIQTKLIDSLLSGKKYYAEFWTVLHDSAGFATNNIGMLFTKKAIYPDTSNSSTEPIYAMPQILNKGNPVIVDTMNWVKVSGIITASGGEQFITIGNFKGDQNTKIVPFNSLGTIFSDYFIDDVSVIPLDSFCLKANAGKDTTIKIGDSVFVGSYTNGIDTLKWYNAAGQVIDSTQPGFWLHNNTAGSYRYIVEQTVGGCFSRDTVNVNVVLPLQMLNYTVISTQEKSVENRWSTSSEINVAYFNIQRSIDGIHFETIGKVVAKNNSYNEYIFTDEQTRNEKQETWYYRLQSVDKDGKTNYSNTKQITINKKQETLLVYPNPVKEVVNIYCKEGIKEVRLYNATGQLIKQEKFSNVANSLHWSVVEAKGIYILQITSKYNNVYNEKLLVQ